MFETLIKALKTKDNASARIKARHRLFWKSPDTEFVKDIVMNANDPIEHWKDCVNWQRKLSNKYNAREFAKMHGVRVADLYWRGRDVEAIDFDSLPGEFVIRPTFGHSCNMVFLMKNGINLFDRQAYSREDLLILLKSALSENKRLEFLIEEFVRNEQGEHVIPKDFKFLMFNGEIASIVVINRMGPQEGEQIFYDENWNCMEPLSIVYPSQDEQSPPACLPEMIAAARKLSKAFGIFVRIDFYATDKGAVFGEFTPTPSRGHGFTPYGEELLTYYWDTYCGGLV